MRETARRWGTLAAGLIAGAAAGWLLRGAPPAPPGVVQLRERGGRSWRFISPLLECDTVESLVGHPELAGFEDRIEALLEKSRRDGRILRASVYFRLLNDGTWWEIGERGRFVPASILKLPTLIAILKRSESEPALLTRPMTFAGGFDANSLMRFPPATTLTPGATYTVGELCRRMVRDSDNNATALLNTIVPRAEFDATLRGLGLDPDQIRNHGAVSIKSLTAFLRVLYNASYLDRTMSEQALEMLSRPSFRDGIVGGVPAGVAVAAKYGEYEPDPSSVQLHEFAIVYHARAPYLLGVMTAGDDYASLKRVIRDVSAAVYREVDEGSPAR